MQLLIEIKSVDDSAADDLLQELPADGILALARSFQPPGDDMKSGGVMAGIVVDLLPIAITGLVKTLVAFIQRPRQAPTTLILRTPDGTVELSFDPKQRDYMDKLLVQAEQVLKAHAASVKTVG